MIQLSHAVLETVNNFLKLRLEDVRGSLIHGFTFSASKAHF